MEIMVKHMMKHMAKAHDQHEAHGGGRMLAPSGQSAQQSSQVLKFKSTWSTEKVDSAFNCPSLDFSSIQTSSQVSPTGSRQLPGATGTCTREGMGRIRTSAASAPIPSKRRLTRALYALAFPNTRNSSSDTPHSLPNPELARTHVLSPALRRATPLCSWVM